MRRAVLTLCALLTAVLLAACGNSESPSRTTSTAGSSTSGEGASTALTVEVLPIPHVAPIYLGIRKGFFAREGLNVKPVVVQDGAAGVAALTSGDAQVAFLSAVPILLARTKGLPVKIVSNATDEQNDPQKQYYALLVRPGSQIKSADDLTGKTVAVNALQAADQLTVSETISQAGGDATKTRFIAMPYPDMANALKQGRVDAIMVSEPFYTLGVEAGDVPIAYPNTVYQGGTSSIYAGADSYVASHGPVIARFKRALTQASDYARAHPDEARQVITTYTKLTPELLKKIRLPEWTTALNGDDIARVADLLVKFRFVSKRPDVSAVLP